MNKINAMKAKYIVNSGSFWVRNAILFMIVSLFFIHTYLFRNYVTDDAFISFRYLENLLKGRGLVYNPGEKVWGYTNFLWIMVLVPFAKINIDPLLGSRVINVICNVFTLFLVLTGFRSFISARMKWNILGSILLVSHGSFVLQSMSGLETSFFTVLVLSALCIYGIGISQKGLRLYFFVGFIMALATLTRPEGLFMFGVLLIHILIYHETGGLQLKRSIQMFLLGFLPVVLIFSISMFLYYGVFWPNSINAKVGLSLEQLFRGLWYFKVFAIRYPLHVLLLLITGFFFRDANVIVKSIFEISGFFIVFNIIAGGDWMLGYRLFHAVIPLTCLLVPFCMTSIERKFVSKRTLSRYISKALLISLIMIFSILNLLASRWDSKVYYATRLSYVHQGIKIGKWMRKYFKSDSLLATNTAGTIAYYSKLPIVDMMGINDTVIANRENVPKEWKGIEKGDGRYVLSRRPDYIQLGSSTGSIEPVFLSDIEIFGSEDFWKYYDLVEYSIDDKTKLLIYRRREKEKLTELSEKELKKIQTIVDQRMRRSVFRY